MTKSQLRDKYLEWNRGITGMAQRKEDIFHELQDRNEEKGDGRRWCSIDKCAEELIKNGEGVATFMLLREYYMIEGREEALRELATATCNFKIS